MMTFPFKLEGAPNFRDLGGYRAAAGCRIRSRQLFRSESLSRLTDADLANVATLNIALLYDLRSTDERMRESNRWPSGKEFETLAGLDSNQLEAVSLFGWRERITDPTFDADSARQWMLGAYAGMPRLFAGVLSSVFDRLSAPSSPVTLMHCTAGKDRTGFVCAMLLFALGVSRDEVFEDYLLSGKRRPPEKLLQTLLDGELHNQPPMIRTALLTMADVREDYLGMALSTIERDFGSVEAYLENACGLNLAQLIRLRSRLLE